MKLINDEKRIFEEVESFVEKHYTIIFVLLVATPLVPANILVQWSFNQVLGIERSSFFINFFLNYLSIVPLAVCLVNFSNKLLNKYLQK